MRNDIPASGLEATDATGRSTSSDVTYVAALGEDAAAEHTTSMCKRNAARYPELTQILTALDAINQRDQETISRLFAPDATVPIKLARRLLGSALCLLTA